MRHRLGLAAALTLVAALAGCRPQIRDLGGDGGGDDPQPPPDAGLVLLSPTDRLVRASMALRGIRPSIDELAAVHGDPSRLASIVDGYTDSPEFLETMRDLHAENFLTRNNRTTFPSVQELRNFQGVEINDSITEEPIRLIEHVIANERPYTEIVTANYTVADRVVAAVWGVPYDGNGTEWVETRWDDGRPRAGILSSPGLFVRHTTNGGNFNRGRANVISRELLCFDFAAQDVEIGTDVDLSDPRGLENAVRNDPACRSCHETLDPLAGFFFGHEDRIRMARLRDAARRGDDIYPIRYYYAAREDDWRDATGRPPAYFGIRGDRLDDLGAMIAEDPRFAWCTARRFYSWFSHVQRDEVPEDLNEWLQARFVASGYDAKALARDIVLADAFQVSHAGDPAAAEEVNGFKRARPEQLRRMFDDLTGYVWRTDASFNMRGEPFGLVDVALNDELGMRTLAGGIDSYFVNAPSRSWNVTTSLFLRGYAANAAAHVVDADFALANPAQRRLLDMVAPGETGEAAVRLQLARLHVRLFGEFTDATGPEIDESWALFQAALAASGDPAQAWKATLTAMFQDLRIAYY